MSIEATNTHELQRERSRSPRRRSRSPRRSRRSYSPRSRSRSRDDYRRSDRRSRSPMTGAQGASGGYTGSYGAARGAPQRNVEDRAAAKEQMMQSLRESSQQDRRVYVGNLSYDVKWHHLKDFMRQGESRSFSQSRRSIIANINRSRRGPVRRCAFITQWDVEGGLNLAGFLVFLWLFGRWIDGWDWSSAGYVGMRVSSL